MVRETVSTPDKPHVTKAQIVAGLRRIGLKAGDLVQVHSSLSAFGHVEGGADALVDALLETVGPGGTVMVPTFNHGGAAVFDIDQTPSTNGVVTNALRVRPEARRSQHPTHPYAAIGPLAAWLTAGHLELTTFDPQSPLGKLAEKGGWVLLLGVGMRANTAAHVGETKALVHCLSYRNYPRRVRLPGSGEVVRAWGCGWRDSPCLIEWDPLEAAMRERGMIQDGRIGAAEVHLMKCRDVIDVTCELTRTLCPKCPARPRPVPLEAYER